MGWIQPQFSFPPYSATELYGDPALQVYTEGHARVARNLLYLEPHKPICYSAHPVVEGLNSPQNESVFTWPCQNLIAENFPSHFVVSAVMYGRNS
jgi:hypothetical protein